MKAWTNGFEDGARIPEKYAFGKKDPKEHMTLSDNNNPRIEIEGVPEGTKSLVVLCVDPDVPSKPDDVNQEGKSVPEDLPRVDFYHWVLVDLAPNASPLEEGEFSDRVVVTGKDHSKGPRGTRQGLNDYTSFFEGDPDMAGEYHGYDGPCPPWNDELLHHYYFTVYATDLERCPVEHPFRGGDVKKAIEGHVLAEASFMGTYSLNPEVR